MQSVRLFFLSVIVAASSLLVLPAAAQSTGGKIIVTGEARKENPSVFLSFAGEAGFGGQLRDTLVRSDWFKVVGSRNEATYVLEARLAGGQYSYGLYTGTDIKASGGGSLSGNQQNFIYAQVDDLIYKAFPDFKPNLCRSRIAFAAGTGKIKEILTCNFDGSGSQQMTHNATISTEPTWWPGSTMFAYTYYTASTTCIAQYDIAGKRQRRLSSFPGLNCSPAISPDGQKMALALSQDHQVDLYVMRVSDKKLDRLTQGKDVESSPTWSPGMDQICFSSDKTGIGKPRLYLISTAGGGATALRPALYRFDKKIDKAPVSIGETGTSQVGPCWSPISNKIAYSVFLNGHYAIAVVDMSSQGSKAVDTFKDIMRRDGGGYKALLLTNDSGNWEDPSWGPDGRHIVCSRSFGGRRTLWQIDSWYGTTMQVTSDSAIDQSLPSWSSIMSSSAAAASAAPAATAPPAPAARPARPAAAMPRPAGRITGLPPLLCFVGAPGDAEPVAPVPKPKPDTTDGKSPSRSTKPAIQAGFGTWWWETRDILEDTTIVLNFLKRSEISELYLWIDTRIPAEAYRRFVAAARIRKIEVQALGGDPAWVLPEHAAKGTDFVAWVAAYNAGSKENERFRGIHLDIEPKTFNADSAKSAAVYQFQKRLLDIIFVATSSNLTVTIDIPAWHDQISCFDGVKKMSLAEWMILHADTTCIMAYRNQADAVINLARDEVMLAKKHGRRIIVAVETGPTDEGAQVSFNNKSMEELDSALAQIGAAFGREYPRKAGLAVHDIRNWMRLPAEPRKQKLPVP
jgi:Tol biopolymer transport system component